MPVNVVKNEEDERHWQQVKTLAAQQGHKDDWAYVMGIYQKMRRTQKQSSYDCYMFIKNLLKTKY